jgi:hypothetical protein
VNTTLGKAAPGPAIPLAKVVTRNRRMAVTLSDYYRDQVNGRAFMERLRGAEDLKSILEALGFVLPREAYMPAPDQMAHRVMKTLFIPAKPWDAPEFQKDVPVRMAATRSCWLYIKDLWTTPLDLTAAESVIVRYSLQCGPTMSVIDFCEVVGQGSENPGQYTPPQVIMVPPTGVLRIDIFNRDQYSEAMLGISSYQWLVPEESKFPAAPPQGVTLRTKGR